MPQFPGDGVLPAGGDSDPGIPLRRAGERLRITDLAALVCAGCARVSVREPRIRVVPLRGSGSGRNDASAQTLAGAGRLVVHGIALTPGETAALGFVGPRPVLLLPGRLDAALAVWLVVGRRILNRLSLANANEHEPAETLTLARKIASTVGLAEVAPVRRNGGQAEPLAMKYLPLSSLARSDGWILVPADSEGYAAGAQVQVRPWP